MNKIIFTIILSIFFTCQAYTQEVLYLFGGIGHNTFLGTINTNENEENSIWNSYGDYGNNFSNTSIWNRSGKYGSLYSDYSPFSLTAQHPPVIVDRWGNFYGYLTINTSFYNRATFGWAEEIYNFR